METITDASNKKSKNNFLDSALMYEKGRIRGGAYPRGWFWEERLWLMIRWPLVGLFSQMFVGLPFGFLIREELVNIH